MHLFQEDAYLLSLEESKFELFLGLSKIGMCKPRRVFTSVLKVFPQEEFACTPREEAAATRSLIKSWNARRQDFMNMKGTLSELATLVLSKAATLVLEFLANTSVPLLC